MKTRSAEHVLPMFRACSFHGNSMNNLLSYCELIDAKIRASDKDLPVQSRLYIQDGRSIMLLSSMELYPFFIIQNIKKAMYIVCTKL